MRRPGKKASLNLSINAIVVLILAITMLGIGLTFIKTIFGGVIEQFGEVSTEIQQQLIDRLKQSKESVAIYPEIGTQITKSSKRDAYLAIRNNLGCGKIGFIIDWPGKTSNSPRCDEVDIAGNCEKVHIKTFGTVDVDSNAVKVVKLKIEAESGVLPDTLRYPIRVTGDCGTPAGIALDQTVELIVDVI